VARGMTRPRVPVQAGDEIVIKAGKARKGSIMELQTRKSQGPLYLAESSSEAIEVTRQRKSCCAVL